MINDNYCNFCAREFISFSICIVKNNRKLYPSGPCTNHSLKPTEYLTWLYSSQNVFLIFHFPFSTVHTICNNRLLRSSKGPDANVWKKIFVLLPKTGVDDGGGDMVRQFPHECCVSYIHDKYGLRKQMSVVYFFL